MGPEPETAALLRSFADSPGPPIEQLTLEGAREGLRALFTALAGPPAPVGFVRAGTLPGPGGPLPYRLYRPEGGPGGRLPLVLFLHGGGWSLGDLDGYDGFCRSLCRESGMLVLSLDYRLAPENPYPAGLDDAYAALGWVAANADALGADPARIVMAGDSAGGTLATSVCRLARDRGGPAVAAQVLLYAVLALADEERLPSRAENGEGGNFLTNEGIAWAKEMYLAGRPDLARDPLVSPLWAEEVAGLPPALVVTAGLDPLRDEGRMYAEKLRAAGVDADYRCHEGTIHAFLSFAGALRIARDGMREVGAWLKARLGA
ncbi:MAG TPA: alpha/beta hydrolase fold domain-containing protein [Azospirillaceae bacterium]|nr:alpha/beta hydrolase fold domain-containing protein [Azospirillaceae bacterium]